MTALLFDCLGDKCTLANAKGKETGFAFNHENKLCIEPS